jgi:hypothetical protein
MGALHDQPPSRLKHFLRTNNPPPGYNWFSENGDDGRSGSDFWYADLQGDGLPELVRAAVRDDGQYQLGYRPNVGGRLEPFQTIQTSDRNDNAQMVVNLDGIGKSSMLIIEKRNMPGYPGVSEVVGQRYLLGGDVARRRLREEGDNARPDGRLAEAVLLR